MLTLGGECSTPVAMQTCSSAVRCFNESRNVMGFEQTDKLEGCNVKKRQQEQLCWSSRILLMHMAKLSPILHSTHSSNASTKTYQVV